MTEDQSEIPDTIDATNRWQHSEDAESEFNTEAGGDFKYHGSRYHADGHKVPCDCSPMKKISAHNTAQRGYGCCQVINEPDHVSTPERNFTESRQIFSEKNKRSLSMKLSSSAIDRIVKAVTRKKGKELLNSEEGKEWINDES